MHPVTTAMGPCRQQELNRRLHGTSLVTQPMAQHPSEDTTSTQTHDSATRDNPDRPSGLRGC